MKDYNTGSDKEIPENIDQVFQGHIHTQESDEDKIHTIRGAGIGGESGTARYVVLTEKPEGGYDMDVRTVRFNKNNTRYDIMESSMIQEDKRKISGWIDAGTSEKGGRSV